MKEGDAKEGEKERERRKRRGRKTKTSDIGGILEEKLQKL